MKRFAIAHLARGCLVSAIAAAAAGTACTKDQVLAQARIPGTSTAATVTEASERGEYLDVTIETGGTTLRFFLPRTEGCAAIAHVGETARYRSLGTLGRLEKDDSVCNPVGILSLRAWRDRRPRGPQPATPVPRAQATFQEVWRDADLILLNGRFPLANRIGWPGGVSTRAVLPVDPLCDEVAGKGVASMEYRAAGRDPLSLVAPSGLCRIVGLVYEGPVEASDALPADAAGADGSGGGAEAEEPAP